MTISAAARRVLLGLADDDLFMGHRHSEWLGVAPFLEEDLAFASIATDELGHARAVYRMLEGRDEVDDLAYGRRPEQYCSSWLAELPGRPWEAALVRHFLYDTAEQLRWENLTESSVSGLAGLAERVLREEAYHTGHAVPLIKRMLLGGEDSQARIEEQLADLLPLGMALFEATEGEEEAVGEGAMARPMAALLADWRSAVDRTVRSAGLEVRWPVEPRGLGARRGVRSEHFAGAHATMTAVSSVDPHAVW